MNDVIKVFYSNVKQAQIVPPKRPPKAHQIMQVKRKPSDAQIIHQSTTQIGMAVHLCASGEVLLQSGIDSLGLLTGARS